MDKIVGKYTLSFTLFLLFFTCLQASISLHLTDMDGNDIDHATVGEPFLLNTLITDVDDAVEEPNIKGLQDLYIKRSGCRLTSINGKQSTQYIYKVRIDKPGVFKLGPAIDASNNQYSNVIRLRVVGQQHAQSNQQQVRQRDRTKKVKEPVLLRLWVDKDTVYVGQKLKTVLRFYFPKDDDISVEQVVSNDPSTITVSEKNAPKKGTQVIEGTPYSFVEWQWDMYAQKPGRLVIPAYFIDYNQQIPVDQFFGNFAIFLGPRYKRKRAYSNALTLEVKPLPDMNQTVDAVGHYVSYRAQIEPAVAKKYEGMVFTLAIEGDGDLQALQEPSLQQLPDSFKWYASKNYIEPTAYGQKKSFEYIVQGLKEGDWEIPAQSFTFFDVDTNTYKTLKTAPLFVSILPGQSTLNATLNTKRPQESQQTSSAFTNAEKEKKSIRPLQVDKESSHQSTYEIPYWLFNLLIIAPLMYFLSILLLQKSTLWIERIAPHYSKRRAFARAKKQLARAYKQYDAGALHAIFMQLFATKSGIPFTTLTKERVDNIIRQSTWSEQDKQLWQLYIEKITQVAYARATAPKNILRLFHEAAHWLQELERII